MRSTIEVAPLRERPELLESVIALGDRFKQVLGLFPREAFKKKAEAGEVLVATGSGGLAGYLLFRVSSRHPRVVTIIHLCVEPESRGQGVARALVGALEAKTGAFAGIRLSCRRDYEANSLWPRLGFQRLGERRGRSRVGALLDVWWLDHGSPLLSYVGPIAGLTEARHSARGLGELFEDIEALAVARADQVLECERALSPAKFTDLEIPCYIIPIRATWAMQLFDTGLAEQELFGLPPELGFRLENVYYRAAQGRIEAPARILWYVSKAKATHAGAGMLRAASYLDEVACGTPGELYSRYKHLGVYRWENLRDMTGGSPETLIMALTFSGSELLTNPLPWSDLQASLVRHRGKENQLQGPLRISSELFFALYSKATAQP